jgi:formate/nitrite transporter
VTITVNTGNPLVGAMLFPVGFIMLYLMGFDLLTGVFTLAPLAVLDKRPGATWAGVLRNWGLVFVGNFAGALTVAVFMAIIFTFGFSEAPNAIGEKLGHIGEGRTLGYAAHGAAGMLTLFIRGVMCNWMVSTGVVAAMMSTTVSGKAIGMWMPVMVFFYMGFEHSIVNMFLFPTGLMLGGKFTLMDYLIWNEIPTVLGNLVGGLTFVGAHALRDALQDLAQAGRELSDAQAGAREVTLRVTLGQHSQAKPRLPQPGLPRRDAAPGRAARGQGHCGGAGRRHRLQPREPGGERRRRARLSGRLLRNVRGLVGAPRRAAGAGRHQLLAARADHAQRRPLRQGQRLRLHLQRVDRQGPRRAPAARGRRAHLPAARAGAGAAHRRPPRARVVAGVLPGPRAGRGPQCRDRLPLLARRGRRGLSAGHRRRLCAPGRRRGARRARRRCAEDFDEAARQLVLAAGTREGRGSEDDCTVQLLRIDALPPADRAAASCSAKAWPCAALAPRDRSRASPSCASCT